MSVAFTHPENAKPEKQNAALEGCKNEEIATSTG